MYRPCLCRICRQNLDNLLCLRPVVLFTKDFACSSCRTLTKKSKENIEYSSTQNALVIYDSNLTPCRICPLTFSGNKEYMKHVDEHKKETSDQIQNTNKKMHHLKATLKPSAAGEWSEEHRKMPRKIPRKIVQSLYPVRNTNGSVGLVIRAPGAKQHLIWEEAWYIIWELTMDRWGKRDSEIKMETIFLFILFCFTFSMSL